MLRIVLDTNVIVSAIISNGKPRGRLKLALQGHFLLIQSKETVEEVAEVLDRPKFKMSGSEIARMSRLLARKGKIVKVRSKRRVVKDDSDDDIFINTALDGNADYIVSSDPHLLSIPKYKGIEIVSVNEMLQRLNH